MYLQNKYTRWYYNIINSARIRPVSGYTEKHHIIPKSLGGTNTADNLVSLTAREHFICHLLLTKMVESTNKTKMVYALWMMNKQNKNQNRDLKINGFRYAKMKEAYSLEVSKKNTGNKLSKETKLKISKSKCGVKLNISGRSELWYKRHAETHKGKSNSQRSTK